MNSEKIVIAITTINIPTFLEDFLKDIGNRENVYFYIIGDYKTPKEIENYLKDLNTKFSPEFNYLDIKRQDIYLNKFPKIKEIMPYNNGVRKMIGNLIAWEEKADYLVMIDDDNFILNNDYLSSIDLFKKPTNLTSLKSPSGWFNVYEKVKEKRNIPFFPRGFPWKYRQENYAEEYLKSNKKVSCINGLVLNDPDIDAITRLSNKIEVVGIKDQLKNFALEPGTWTSFNNQNTIISRDIIPAYFTPPATGRNADIWTSFIMCKLFEIHEELLVFGHPLVRQDRNPHNIWNDLNLELQNNLLTDYFVDLLKSLSVKKSKTHLHTMIDICKKAKEKIEECNLSKTNKQYISEFFDEYLIWTEYF